VHLLKSGAEAEDVTQDTFVRAYGALDRFDGRSEAFTWIYRIAVNLSLNTIRARKPGRKAISSDDPRLEGVLIETRAGSANPLGDSEGRWSALQVEVDSPARELDTQESLETYNKKKFAWFVHVDDSSIEERIWAYCQLADDGQSFELAHYGRSRSSFGVTNLQKIGYLAAKAGTAEYAIDWHYENKPNFSITGVFLIDLARKLPYAVRVTCKTSTGSGVFERAIPALTVGDE